MGLVGRGVCALMELEPLICSLDSLKVKDKNASVVGTHCQLYREEFYLLK